MQDEAEVRRQKLDGLIAQGVDPYPSEAGRDTTCGDAMSRFDEIAAAGTTVALAGRILTTRVHGAMTFADLADETGSLQISLKEDDIGKETYEQFRDNVDPGDLIEVTGTLFTTKRGEKTLSVASWRMLAKALLPLPEKWHGLQDVEKRYREREMDLLSNPDVRHRFLVRSKIVASLRRFLDARGFIEVETPILQPIPGGANARPFVTHHHALDVDLYLRIAPELYLKRLVVGGFEKVYEIGRCFRNEGIDHAHNPEFTMIELYWAYVSKETYIAFMETLLTTAITDATGSLKVPQEDGAELDFTAPWPRTTFRDAINDACGIDIDTLKTSQDVEAAVRAKKLSVDFSDCHGLGEYFDELYKKTARLKMIQPTWVFDYPVELKPLAARSDADPQKSASAQLIVQGTELVNAYYHELHDPIEQRERLMEQQALREEGSEIAQRVDDAFLRAMEHGMPPTSGMGLGIDRFTAILTGAPNLKEVILFPTLRPEQKED